MGRHFITNFVGDDATTAPATGRPCIAADEPVRPFEHDRYGAGTVLTSGWGGTADGYDWAYRFQGGRMEAATGDSDFRNRAYNPTLGRWLQQDGGYWDGSNLYQMNDSRPPAAVDPFDRDPKKPERPDWQPDEEAKYDLMVFASSDFHKPYTKGIDAYQKQHPQCKVVPPVAGRDALIKAISDRYDEVNKGNKNPRPISVIVVGHSGDTGPLVGDGESAEGILDLPVSNSWEELKDQSDDQLRDQLKKQAVAAVAGKVNTLVFTGCSTAATDTGKRIRKDLADVLIGRIVAATKDTDTWIPDTGALHVYPHKGETPPPGGLVYRTGDRK